MLAAEPGVAPPAAASAWKAGRRLSCCAVTKPGCAAELGLLPAPNLTSPKSWERHKRRPRPDQARPAWPSPCPDPGSKAAPTVALLHLEWPRTTGAVQFRAEARNVARRRWGTAPLAASPWTVRACQASGCAFIQAGGTPMIPALVQWTGTTCWGHGVARFPHPSAK
jgi:hypothetical protein